MNVKRCCLVTHQILDRENLFRVVKTKDNEIKIDLSYSIQGRGAYILKDIAVISKAKNKDLLSRALRHKVDKSIYDELIELAKGVDYGKE